MNLLVVRHLVWRCIRGVELGHTSLYQYNQMSIVSMDLTTFCVKTHLVRRAEQNRREITYSFGWCSWRKELPRPDP